MNPIYRRCVGTPPPGQHSCPRPATHWQVRLWDGPVHLNLCAEHYEQTKDRSDVQSHGAFS
jgi:hypothetical protein